ncbi:MAG: ORF6N domain-containing protein [Acidobacteria bacterium]|nr:ORF6N domain-containing protein [Acidobacteriota bacterium]
MIRGQKVMFDRDLATLYRVETKVLNRAVKRNRSRFPEDFRFQLTAEEAENLRCQFGTSSWGGSRYLPYAFTEHGAVMLASVLSSRRAVEMSVVVVRAFIMLREVMATHRELARRVESLEHSQKAQGQNIASIQDLLARLMEPPVKPPRRIGFPVKA